MTALAQTGVFFGSLTDPVGDGGDGADVVEASVLFANEETRISVRLAPGTYDHATHSVGVVFDTDQDPSTGFPGVSSNASIDVSIIGAEFVVLLPRATDLREERAELLRYVGGPFDFRQIAVFPVTLVPDGVEFAFPSALLEDDGLMNFKVTPGPILVDVAPDVGLAAASTAPLTSSMTPLADDIGDLVADDILTMGQASALLSKLAAAVASLARGNTTAACNQLQALTNQVEAFIRSGKLTAAEGQVLLDEAESFSNLIGC